MAKYTVVVGNFDGVHEGHCRLIQLGKQTAEASGEKLAVFTFFPQPQELFRPDFSYLLSNEKKQARLKSLGVDWILSVPFEASVGDLLPAEFVERILIDEMDAGHVVVGYNFSFGKDGAGKSEDLKRICEERGIPVTIMPAFEVDGEAVSSSAIRSSLVKGEMEKVNRFLGYPYTIEGVVEHGRQLGRTIGYPTANIALPEKILLPAVGVYAAMTYVGEKAYQSFLNIGYRPTVENSVGETIEVNLFDFSDDLYGQVIRTELYHFMRGEKKFDGLEALKEQLRQDEADARALLTALHRQ